MKPNTPYATILAGGQPLLRAGVASILTQAGHSVAAQLDTVADVAQFLTDNPLVDMVILDDTTTDLNTQNTFRYLTELYPQIHFMLLADPDKADLMRMALQAGVHGVAPKSAAPEGFLGVVELIMQGESVFPSRVLQNRRLSDADEGPQRLTPREEEIVTCLARGFSNKEIARSLDVAEGTVKVHIKAILKKLALANRTQVAIYAYDKGMV